MGVGGAGREDGALLTVAVTIIEATCSGGNFG